MGKRKFKSSLNQTCVREKKKSLNFDLGLNQLNINWKDIIEFPLIYRETDYNHTDTYIINAPHIQMFCLIEYKDKWDDFNYLTLQVMNTIEILEIFFIPSGSSG